MMSLESLEWWNSTTWQLLEGQVLMEYEVKLE